MESIRAIGPLFSTATSLIFLVIGAVAVYTMMAKMGIKDVSRPEVYTKIHRIAGWSFTTLFVGIFIYMIIRLRDCRISYEKPGEIMKKSLRVLDAAGAAMNKDREIIFKK